MVKMAPIPLGYRATFQARPNIRGSSLNKYLYLMFITIMNKYYLYRGPSRVRQTELELRHTLVDGRSRVCGRSLDML